MIIKRRKGLGQEERKPGVGLKEGITLLLQQLLPPEGWKQKIGLIGPGRIREGVAELTVRSFRIHAMACGGPSPFALRTELNLLFSLQ